MAVSAGLMSLWLHQVGMDRLRTVFLQVNLPAFLPVVAANLLLPILAAWRWGAALEICGIQASFKETFKVFLAAWPVASVTPGKIGDLVRVWALGKEGKKMAVLASLIVERIFDLGVLAGLALLGAMGLFPERRIWILSLLAAGVLSGWLFFRFQGGKLVRRIFQKMKVAPTKGGLARPLALLLASSGSIWMLSVAQWDGVLWALGIPSNLLDSLLKVPLALMAGMIPLAWMGIGTRDGTFLGLYAGQVPPEKILAASLVFTAIRYLAPGVLGWPWTFWVLRGTSTGKKRRK